MNLREIVTTTGISLVVSSLVVLVNNYVLYRHCCHKNKQEIPKFKDLGISSFEEKILSFPHKQEQLDVLPEVLPEVKPHQKSAQGVLP